MHRRYGHEVTIGPYQFEGNNRFMMSPNQPGATWRFSWFRSIHLVFGAPFGKFPLFTSTRR